MTTELTRQYWLRVFDEWARSRLPGPQYDEAHLVLEGCGLQPQDDYEEDDDYEEEVLSEK
jgi:hypothetical protein